jgi:hypothetical protein
MTFISRLIDRYKESKRMQQEERNRLTDLALKKEEFKQIVLRAIDDGKLTDEEIEEIEKRQAELDLSDSEVKGIRIHAYKTAYLNAKEDGSITTAKIEELEKLKTQFDLTDDDVACEQKVLLRLRLITQIAEGSLPVIAKHDLPAELGNLILQKGETVHWIEVVALKEEKVISKKYEGGSQGVSIRLAKGLHYRVGGHRGHLVSTSAVVPVSIGGFIITNKRIIFRGDKKSFSLRHDNILDISFYDDGVSIAETSGKNRLVTFAKNDNIDIMGAIIDSVINQ